MSRGYSVTRMAMAGMMVLTIMAGWAPGAHGVIAVRAAPSAAEVFSPNAVTVDQQTHRVFVSHDDTVSMLAATGSVLWTTAVGPSPRGVAIDARAGRVFVANWGREGYDRGTVSVLTLAGGALIRTTTVGINPVAVTVDETTRHVLVTNLHSVSMLDARTGRLLRTVPQDGFATTPVAIDERTGRAFAPTYDNTIFGKPAYGANYVSVLDSTDGALLRRVQDMHGPIAVAVDARSHRAFVANEDGTISILDAWSGALVHVVQLPRRVYANAVAVDEQDGRVFVSAYAYPTFQGYIGILDGHRGTLIRLAAVGATPFTVAVDARAGRAFVGTMEGVSVLNVTSGRMLPTLDVGGSADSLAVDSRGGRLMVTSGNGSLRIFDTRTGLLMHTTVLRGGVSR